MRIAVFGPGGVGGYLAARLAASDAADVTIIGRGRHLQAIRTEGLRLESPHGDLHVRVPATDDPQRAGTVDVVLLTVKGTDTPAAAERLRPLMGPETVVVTFQNGIDSPRQVARVVGDDAVLPGVAYIFSTVAAPGVVRHTAGPARFVFGEPAGARTGRADAVQAALALAGIDAEVVDDIDVALWSKFVIICATAGATAPSRLPIDVLRQDPAALELFRDLAREAAEVGRATGVALPDDTVDRTMEFVASIGPDAYSSLLYDLVNGKPMELETLHGTIVRLADEHGVDVPVSRTIYALLSPWASRNAASAPPGDPSAASGN